MKKFLFFVSAIAGLFLAGSCQREMMDPVVEGGVTYTITLDDGVQTKGANGYTEYDLYYQIYKTVDPTELETAVLLFEDKVEMNGNTTHVALELLNSQDYTVLFWANRKGADWFELGDLRNVVLKETLSNNDNRDAFCGKDELINFDANQSKTVQLKRPFAQINIATLVPAKEELGYDVNPEASLVRVSNVPVAYNVAKAQTVGTEEEVTFGTAASPAAKLNVRGTDYKMVAMNYVLVPAGNINDLYYEITTPNGIVKNTIHNIPVKPNYRTNIIGNLLTSKADYTVEILPGFENSPEGDEIVEVWNGSAVTKPVWNAEGNFYEITLASELAWFAQQVNQAGVDTRSASDEMVKNYKLMNDIDLQNQLWIPIGANEADKYRYKIGTFDGNGYSIKNLNVDRKSGAGLFGFLHGGTITNVTIDGFEVNSNHYAGAVLGWGESGAVVVNVTNCKVKNGTVTVAAEEINGAWDNGDKAGAVVGWNYAGNITGNTAEGVTVTAYRDLGGILGYASKSTVTGNTISNVILVQDLEHNYKNYTAEEAAGFVGSFVGRVGEASTIQDNNGEARTDLAIASEGLLKKEIRNDAGDVTRVEYYVIKKEGLWEVAKMVNTPTKAGNGSWNIALTSDIDLNNEEWTPIGTGEGGFTGVFDGQGHTISNLKITGNNNKVGLFANTYGGEIKNLTIHNASVSGCSNVGVVAGNPYSSKYTNIKVTGHVEVDGKFYVGGVGGKNAYADWTNITVDVDETSYVKANSVEDGIAYRTYVGGVVGFNGEGGHSFTNITSNIDVSGSTIDVGGLFGIAHYGNNFVNCSSSGDVEITDAAEAADAEEIGGLAGVWHNQNGETVTFKNCKFTGTLTTNITEGVDLTDNTITGKAYSATGTGKLIIDGWEYIADGVAFKDDVYELYNAAGLKWVAEVVNATTPYTPTIFDNATVQLANDIDLNNEEWIPIGDDRSQRTEWHGVFDGKGHTVSNIKITKKTDRDDADKSSYGLFGNVKGTVKNLTVENVSISGAPKFIGALVGRLNDGLIENCHVKNSSVECENWTIGGVVGQWNNGVIRGCSIEKSIITGYAGVGAIAGLALNGGERTLENCSVKDCAIVKNGSFGGDFDKMFGTVLGALYNGELVVKLNGCSVENTTINGVVSNDLCGFVAEGDKLFIDGYEFIADGVMSKESNYYVSNLAGFNWFADQVNGGNTFANKTVNLTSDIDLNNEEWTPIGNSTNKFQGTFDAQNHIISNLFVDGGSNSDQGLFGMTTNGEIKNLVVNNAKVSGRLNVGVVVGTPYTSKYTNIKLTGHVEVNGMAYVGGVGGKNAYASWTDVTVDVDETSYVKANSVENGKAYRTYVGGVCGFNGEGGHSFTNITSNIDVTGSTIDVGGLFGIAHYGNNFVNCSSSGDVEITDAAEAADAEEIGGIAGVWNNGGSPVTFENCKFTGTLTANITEGVDLTDNTITGKAYSATGTGQLIIK